MPVGTILAYALTNKRNRSIQQIKKVHKYLSKSFLYSFFSVSGEETRGFPLSERHHAGKKPVFLPGQILKTYG
ncbi:Uncharacterized protein dnm_027580 [Desulfonema magnum]|uniref:Uncharacterized protein n=1 Tax=Desulfonema magnum TaxID=45655 RepID=A0A975BJA1_9BACT|nr:Uncharacterized protein dnm_027580 [Desulfonema magnum]